MTVAVGFSPRSSTRQGVRRGATLEGCKTSRLSFNRRSATTLVVASDRGLKPTATVTASRREDRAAANRDPLKTARNRNSLRKSFDCIDLKLRLIGVSVQLNAQFLP